MLQQFIPNTLLQNAVSYTTLTPGKGTFFPGLNLDKYDLAHGTFRETIKYYEINRASEKPCVFRIVGKIRKKWNEVLGYLSPYYRLASPYSIATNGLLFRGFPYGKQITGFLISRL